jgi:hypothetical protein
MSELLFFCFVSPSVQFRDSPEKLYQLVCVGLGGGTTGSIGPSGSSTAQHYEMRKLLGFSNAEMRELLGFSNASFARIQNGMDKQTEKAFQHASVP